MRAAHPRIVLGLHRSRHERHLLTGALDLAVEAIDTSFNYLGFHAHAALAKVAGDLLPKFTVSTKVGYFPASGRAEHSLDPTRLKRALEQTNRDLGRAPDLVFLHNPEHSLRGATEGASEAFAQACAVLEGSTAKGLCGTWGIASWDPSPLPDLIDSTTPRPSVLMVRAGLLVGIRTLDAADSLTSACGLGHGMVWGMSPFGGSASDPVWDRIDPRIFLRDGGDALSRVQAAFRAAYRLPQVGTVAVGTDDPAHLGDLIGALDGEVDEEAVHRYRSLLRDRLHGQPA